MVPDWAQGALSREVSAHTARRSQFTRLATLPVPTNRASFLTRRAAEGRAEQQVDPLHVTEGVGVVGPATGKCCVRAGDTSICPPDEDHWHGAAADIFMSHLAMLESRPDGGDPTTWLEPVPGAEYSAANKCSLVR